MKASTFVKLVKSGKRVEFTGIEIIGVLDLQNLKIEQSIRCKDCVIDGAILASDVTFAEAVDLEGVTLKGRVDLRGAKFEGPMLARGDKAGGGASDSIDFSFARFEQQSAFDGLSFKGPLRFEGAFFADNTSFVGTNFADVAVFDRAHFAASADFGGRLSTATSDSVTSGDATFLGASFDGSVNFGQRIFNRKLLLDHSRAGDSLSLSHTKVHERLSMDGAKFADVDAKNLSVDGFASIAGSQVRSLSFEGATFDCSLNISGTSVADKATLRTVNLPNKSRTDVCDDPHKLFVSGFTAGDLSMDQSLIALVPNDPNDPNDDAKRKILSQIEVSARASGTVADANQAHYALLALDGGQKSRAARILDGIYRDVGGYLVRPSRPLVALLLLIVIGTFVRYVRRRILRPATTDLPTTPSAQGTTGVVAAKQAVTTSCRGTSRLASAFARTVGRVLSPTPPDGPDEETTDASGYMAAGALMVEYIASKVLIIVFILSLANYNSTLHDIVNGLFK
ncbi:MAG TPA: pentapeptide repeat-containing protein [Acidimicrobiia bacterium]|nr:pentapeptide repeat-containing protein [Acidimicrobiia bacterium]